MSEKEARMKLIFSAREHLADSLINLSTALLIWFFGALVFLPAAYRIERVGLPLACAVILLIGFSIFVFKAFGGFRLLLEVTSNVLANECKRRCKCEFTVERLRPVFRCLIYVVAVLIVFALYSPFLVAIHPSLGGLVFIPIVLWIFFMLFRILNSRS